MKKLLTVRVITILTNSVYEITRLFFSQLLHMAAFVFIQDAMRIQ